MIFRGHAWVFEDDIDTDRIIVTGLVPGISLYIHILGLPSP